MLGKKHAELLFNICNNTLLMILAFICLYPFLFMITLSFNEGTDTLQGGVSLIPRTPTIVNYLYIFQNKTVLLAYRVTILKTVIGTVTSLLVTALVAYGLSEKKLPGRKFIMIYMLIPMFFGGGLIPTFINLRNLGLIDNFLIYIIPGMFSIWNCIIMRTSFSMIPESLKESVQIEGGNDFTIFTRIILPLSMPMLAALALFTAVGHWNDWFTGAFFVQRQHLVPVQTLLQMLLNRDLISYGGEAAGNYMGLRGTDLNFGSITSFSLKMATVVTGTLPILIIYPFLQKYFIKGVLIGSIKG